VVGYADVLAGVLDGHDAPQDDVLIILALVL
jgi:hypothetical protein